MPYFHLVFTLPHELNALAQANPRLLYGLLEAGHVRFRYRDRAHGNRRKVMRLPALAFLARFLTHVLPRGFMRIRNSRAARQSPQARVARSGPRLRVSGLDIELCPACRSGRLRFVAALPPQPRLTECLHPP